MLFNEIKTFFPVKGAVYFVILAVFMHPFQHCYAQKRKVNFNFSGIVRDETNEKALEGVKIELIKNSQIIQSIITQSDGKFKMNWEINQVDSNDANYTVSFTNEKMIPKSAKFNTFIRQTLASSYDFEFEVFMTPRSEGDVIVDLPSAKVKWDERRHRFSVDQKYANIMKEIKQTEDPEKARKLIEEQKKAEEEAKRAAEAATRKAAEAEKKATEEAMKRQVEALRRQQAKLDSLAALEAALQKAREDSASQAAAASLKRSMEALKKQVTAIKKDEPAAVVPTPAPKPAVVVTENENEKMVKEVYSIRDVKALRARTITLPKELQKRKIRNRSSKYETENPLTSLLDEIDEYEKNSKKSGSK